MEQNSNNYLEINFLDNEQKTLVLVLPGGSYQYTSKREGKPVAKHFEKLGYHTAIYHYRETMLTYPDIFIEAKKNIEKLLKDYRVKDIIIIGLSAGGHMASYLLTTEKTLFKAGILCYPVISTDDEIMHKPSFKALLGDKFSANYLSKVSTEKLITENMPPIYLWHTLDDAVVSVENSINFFTESIKKKNSIEAHFFKSGRHGLSIIEPDSVFDNMPTEEYIEKYSELKMWVNRVDDWIKNL